MYTIIGGLRSRTFRVLWMLEELGVPYVHNPAAPRSDEVTALNPSGKVPVLLVDGVALTDSTAIIQYLADKQGQMTFPAGSLDRARQDGLTQFVLDELDAVLWTASRHSFILPEEMRMPQIKDSLKWEFGRSIERLAAKLGDGPFLMGETMTVPDIIATHCCSWAANAKFPIGNAAVVAYADRMRARPAHARVAAMG